MSTKPKKRDNNKIGKFIYFHRNSLQVLAKEWREKMYALAYKMENFLAVRSFFDQVYFFAPIFSVYLPPWVGQA